MQFREIEVKHDASEISLQQFKQFMESHFEFRTQMNVSSCDDYFVDKDNNYIRYRHKEGRGELTIKRKLTEQDNNKRIEVNLPTDGNVLSAVTQFSELLGYRHNFSVYKTCQVYWTNDMVICYYVVYDNEWKELRRFIEIEAEEHFPWESENAAWAAVEQCEAAFAPLGLHSNKRMSKSLFELFKKN